MMAAVPNNQSVIGDATPADLHRFFKIVNAYGFWSGSSADKSAVGIRSGNAVTVARRTL
jgi:hypothetical protein